MNDTYWDSMDGSTIACGDNGPSRLESICAYHNFFIGCMFFLNAMACFVFARKQVRLDKLREVLEAEALASINIKKMRRLKQERNRNASHSSSHCNVLGSTCLAASLTLSLGGGGTRFPTSHIQGFIADVIFAIYFLGVVRICYRQVKGAKWFSSLLETNNSVQLKRDWPGEVADFTQTKLTVAMSLLLCILRGRDKMTRTQFYGIHFGVHGLFGLRAFCAIVFHRAKKLAHVAKLHDKAGGNMKTQIRRRKTLQEKTAAVVVDMFVVGVLSIFYPFSMLMSLAVWSSERYIKFSSVSLTLVVLGMIIFNVLTYRKLSHTELKFTRKYSNAVVPTLISGSNTVVSLSVHETRVGLFSEAEVENMGPGIIWSPRRGSKDANS